MVCLRFRGLRTLGMGFQPCIWVVNQILSRSFDSRLQKERKTLLRFISFVKKLTGQGKIFNSQEILGLCRQVAVAIVMTFIFSLTGLG